MDNQHPDAATSQQVDLTVVRRPEVPLGEAWISDQTPAFPVVFPKPRLRSCVKAWPECVSGGYDPRCCRFPKSCSCESPLTVDNQPDAQWATGEITVKHIREQFIITDAPERALMSLQVLMANPQGIRVVGDLMYLGEPDVVTYRIVGLVHDPLALTLERYG